MVDKREQTADVQAVESQAGEAVTEQHGASALRRVWHWMRWIVGGLVLLVAALAGAVMWLDSSSGHRFVAQKVGELRPENGLRINIGKIDGSLFRKASLRDVRLSDPKGVFLSSPEVQLDWSPLGWLSNRLDIDELIIPQARLHKLPQFKETKSTGKILPDFDIRIMRLQVARLAVDKAVIGREDSFSLDGDADIRGGHAVADLSVRSLKGDDRLVLSLDSRPDDNRFDVDMTVNARAGGLLATMAGLTQDANVRLQGKGDWNRWNGSVIATLNEESAAGFGIALRKGNWAIEGNVAGSAIANDGLIARLTSPQLAVKAQGRFEKKLLSGTVDLGSDAIALSLKGGVHLGGRGFDNLTADLTLKKPQALLDDFSAKALVARFRINGPMDAARFEYLMKADELRFGTTRLRGVHAMGDGRTAGENGPTIVPVKISAKTVDGQGDMVASILRNVGITGTLQVQDSIITSSPLKVRSDKLDGSILAKFNLETKRYDATFNGDLRKLLIPKFGIVDLHAQVKATPDARGAFTLGGKIDAGMRRFDISFLKTVAGGLPRARSDIALGANGRLALRNLVLTAPDLTLRGQGVRNADGTIEMTGEGRHAQYGPLKLALSGDLTLPHVDLMLSSPMAAVGLADVHVVLDPEDGNYRLQTEGQSALGAFSGHGLIEMPAQGQTAIIVEQLNVAGAQGQGRLGVVDGGLDGRLDFDGSIKGPITLSVVDGVQHAQAALRVEKAQFDTGSIARGQLNMDMALNPDGTAITGKFVGNGIQISGVRINRINADVNLVNGAGKVNATIIGQQGRPYNLKVAAEVASDQISFALSGALDRQPISLNRKGVLRQVDGGWSLDPLTIRYAGGRAVVNKASFGDETQLDVSFGNLSLSLLDLTNKDLGLGGKANGRIVYSWDKRDGARGTASVKIIQLSRSGITRTSTPMDIGLNASLTDSRLEMRSLISQDGKIVGKAQALMTPLASEGSLIEKLKAAPLRAQVRYIGPASSLWRLATVEIIDLTGQIGVTADISGTGGSPIINGALMTKGAVLESPTTGMRVTNLNASGRFNGSRLVLSQVSGETKGDGTVTGWGIFDLAPAGGGVGINIALQAKNATLLDRDDIGATVTGPVTIRSKDGVNGVIGGTFDVISSRFTMGRAATVAEIPQMKIIEKNGRRDDFAPTVTGAGWTLNIKAKARNRLMVSGMGLSSEWRMDVDVGGQVIAPKIVGRADLVRGTYDFAGRRFDLKEGALRFDGSVPANPTLDIDAEATLTDLDALISIKGTATAPEISFSSTPSLPEDEVLSRLLFGSSITNLSAPEALQLASAVAALQGGGGGLDPINAVRKAAGLDRLRIMPADPTTGQGTSIGVGKYLTRRIYVELITDGQGYSATRLEYQVTRWLSLLSSVSTLGRQSITARASKDY